MQFILSLFSLQSSVFTSLKSNNDFGKKEQFSCLLVLVCLQETNRKGLQFGVTIGTCADSYPQNMQHSFPSEVDTLLTGRETENAYCLHFILRIFRLLWSTLQRRVTWEILSGRYKDSPHPSCWPS